MMAMDEKGITWVGNMYQKFEDMCLEVEDNMFEETVKYIENQMQTVGESVKRLYEDVMEDLLPPSSCDLDERAASELPTDQYTVAGLSKKSFQGSKRITVKAETEQKTEDSSINHDVDDDAVHAKSCNTVALIVLDSDNSVKGNKFISHARHYVGSKDIKSNIDSDENRQNKEFPASKIVSELALSKTDTCSTSQSCELSNLNQNHAAAVSMPASAGETTLASVAGSCKEIENVSTEQTPDVLVLVKSTEEKEMNMISSSSFLFGDPDGFSIVRAAEPEDCSYNTTIVSHSESQSSDIAKIDTVIEQSHETMQQNDELKLEETCVMVTRDELQLVPKAVVNLKTNEKKRLQPFSLSKKSARKQEYEVLAMWHGNNEKDYSPTSLEDQKKLLPPDTEPEWELL